MFGFEILVIPSSVSASTTVLAARTFPEPGLPGRRIIWQEIQHPTRRK